MIAAGFWDKLHLAAGTPESIAVLRRLFIALGMRGKLVNEAREESAATDIIRCIEAKWDALRKREGCKEKKPIQRVAADGLPSEYAAQCVFVSLASISIIRKGLTPIKSARPGGYPLVVTAEERSSCDHYDFEGAAAIIPMVSSTGHGDASLKRIHYQEGRFALGSILCAVFPISEELISARFLYQYLCVFKEELLVSKMVGTANVSLTIDKIGQVPIPILSSQAQGRLSELIELCDQLEASQTERERRRERLAVAALRGLSQPNEPNFRQRANFYLQYLPCLTARPGQLRNLRQTALDLAVKGRLVAQSSDDEPAGELLKRIHNEKVQLDRKKAYKYDPLPPVGIDEVPFKIPDGWEWARLGSVCYQITDGAHHTPVYQKEGIPFLSVKDVSGGVIDFSGTRFISEAAHRELCGRCKPELGDILLTKVGTTGIAVTVDTGREFSVFVSLALLKFSQSSLDGSYLRYLINSPLVRQQSEANTQGTGNKNLVLRLIKRFVIPIPPLAEQRRIVAKIDELFTVCDRLEQQLAVAQAHGQQLLEALLNKALAAF